jgi:hypothetical protein
MKKRLSIAALLFIAASLGYGVYLFCFKTISNEEIVTYGWKGGGCGLPDVLDFRKSRNSTLRLDGDILYRGNTRLGLIVTRNYRPSIEPVIEIATDTGDGCEVCPFWGKWEN